MGQRTKPKGHIPAYVFASAKAGQKMQERTGFARPMSRLPRTLEEMRAIPALKEVSPGPPPPFSCNPLAAEDDACPWRPETWADTEGG
jgi:hypothetical protein